MANEPLFISALGRAGKPRGRPRRSSLAARLDCVSVPTATRVWDADGLVECAMCEGDIPTGDLFTMALAKGHGRRHVPHCRTCRPFMVVTDA